MQQKIKQLCEKSGLQAGKIEQIKTGRFNTTFSVRLNQPANFGNKTVQDVIIRIAPPDDAGFLFYEANMMAKEPELHRQIQAKTSIPVPAIFVYDSSRKVIDRDYLIMEFMPGVPMSEKSLTESGRAVILKQTGNYLHELHENVRTDKYGYLGESNTMPAQDNWQAAFEIMWNNMIDDIAGCGVYATKDAEFARGKLQQHIQKFDLDTPSCLLHMDIWGQNILVNQQNEITAILDWDRAVWGDPGIEFAIIDYVGFDQPAFWNGYGKQPKREGDAQIRHVFYYLYEVQKYLVIWTLRRSRDEMVRNYKNYCLSILNKL